MAPGLTRLPLPWEVVALIALNMLEKGFLAILQHLCYLRPAEILCVQGDMLIRPAPGTSHTNGKLVLHPHEAEQPSKTQEFDEVVTIDLKMYKELRNHGLDVLKSVRGYRKEGRVSQQLSGLPVETRARAIAAPRLLKPALNKL